VVERRRRLALAQRAEKGDDGIDWHWWIRLSSFLQAKAARVCRTCSYVYDEAGSRPVAWSTFDLAWICGPCFY
jgi:hypothetical protein